jgi:two-component system response regulator YesN
VQWRADPEQLMNMDAHFSWRKVNDYLRDIGLSIIMSKSTEKSEWNQNLVAQINQYVGEHLAEDISLVSIADRFHFHPSYLARLYKHFTGITLGQFIINMKMNEARKMLGSSSLMINDIARLLGFSSVAYFSKFFKINCGLTPSDFRRQIMTVEG